MKTQTTGNKVKRIAKDYTNGRIGTVVEVDQEASRARVAWSIDSWGAPMKLRTWIRFSDLETLAA